MDIIAVNDERTASALQAELRHPIKVHEEAEEDVVGRGAVLENAKEVRFEGDGGDVARMECESGCRGGEGSAGGGGECIPDR